MAVDDAHTSGPVPSIGLRARLRASGGNLDDGVVRCARIGAGQNNAVFEVHDDGDHTFVTKVITEPLRAMREVAALSHLRVTAPAIVPRVFEVIVARDGVTLVLMERLHGPTLDGGPLDAAQLDALVDALGCLHATRPPVPWNAHRGLHDLAEHVGQLGVAAPRADPRVLQRWEKFRDGPLHDELLVEPTLVFGRGDPNLQNVIDTAHGLRFVDFEYAGMTDEIYAYADLAAHVRSAATPLSSWRAAFASLLTTNTAERRFETCVELLTFYWYLRLSAIGTNPELIAWASGRLNELEALGHGR